METNGVSLRGQHRGSLMGILKKIIEHLKKNPPTNFVCGHLTAKNGAQIGEYSLGVQEISYVDKNGNVRTEKFWVAQR